MDGEVRFTHYAEVNPKRLLARGREYPFIEMAALPEGGGELSYVGRRVFDGQGSRFALGDTLFARITPCTENGKTSIVRDLGGSETGFGSTEFIVFAARAGVSPEFVHQLAIAPEVRRRAVSRMLGTSGRQRVPTWFFEDELTLPRFSGEEQVAIGDTLHAIDEAIEKTEAVIAATEELRKALLQELLTRGVPGWHTAWKTVPGIGTIPACWDVVPLGDHLARGPSNGIYKPESDYGAGTWIIRIGDFEPGRLSRHEFERIRISDTERAVFSVSAGDILINRVNSLSHLGKSVLIPALQEAAVFESNMMRLRPDSEMSGDFLLALLCSPLATRHFTARAKKAVAQCSINQTDVRQLMVPVPEAREQGLIARCATVIDEALEREDGILRELRTTKNMLADALLSGRARIPLKEGV